MEATITLPAVSLVLLKEAEQWTAQCLEYDITGQGNTPEKAIKEFEHIFMGHAILDKEKGDAILKNIPKAPDWYWALPDKIRTRESSI